MATKKNALAPYQKKRQFKETPEPKGSVKKRKKSKQLQFVIQKHDASHLHYDFRLEIEGVLESWAVPKGIPIVIGERHLAIPTEPHPMDYATFEGVIPEGHYGAGTVMVWDIGTYENLKSTSMQEAMRKGRIEIVLHGKKLRGAYALIRMKKNKYSPGKVTWLLLKMSDDKPIKKSSVNEKSVLTKRTMKQIAQEADSVWE